jgi:hypothetical protein
MVKYESTRAASISLIVKYNGISIKRWKKRAGTHGVLHPSSLESLSAVARKPFSIPPTGLI